VIGLALVMSSRSAAGRSSHVTPATLLAIEHWSHAVLEHSPGAPDASVTFVRSLSFEARQDLNGGMELFLRALVGKSSAYSSAEEKRVVEIGATDGQSVGANAFLDRAAVLHADAVMVGGAWPTKPPGPPGAGHVAAQATSASPLLSSGSLVLANDGEYVGAIETNWNWTFARSLLDLVSPQPAASPFMGQWYHATAAYLLRYGEYGEAKTHLAHVAALLPDDPRILFDRACLSEILGLPQSQQLLTDQDRVTRRTDATWGRVVTLTSPERARRVDIPVEAVANENAERLFQRTLQVAPTFVEARVRLARLLEVRGRFTDALTELSMAVNDRAVAHDPVVLFYAQLFAARAEHALGRVGDAVRHDDEAIALFPDAQSALLARSQLALVTADVGGALAPISRLAVLPVDAARRTDPWWQYQFGPGRDADGLLAQMWANLVDR
jgi:tetratricopeptide (TPR) repeat protein